MIESWLHLDERGSDPWILPIYGSLNNKGLLENFSDENKELGLAVTIKLNTLPRVVRRVNSDIQALFAKCEGHKDEHVFRKTKEGFAYSVDNDLKYQIIADIELLLFEIKSSSELMTNFMLEIYKAVGIKKDADDMGKIIKKIIDDSGLDSMWFVSLAGNRNFFIHEGAPYLAVDTSNGKGNYDLVVMKENIVDLTSNDNWFSLSTLNKIVNGFIKSNQVLQQHMVAIIDAKS